MNTLETLTIGATSLMFGWAVFGRPICNFYKAKEENYDKEFSKLVEEYE